MATSLALLETDIDTRKVYLEFEPKLKTLGHVCIAGGAVRDGWAGLPIKDYDIYVLLGRETTEDDRLALAEAVKDVELSDREWVKEPYLERELLWRGVIVQVMLHPARTETELMASFDWNLSRYSYPSGLRPESVNELKLYYTTRPRSTFMRGVRYAARYGLDISDTDLRALWNMMVLDARRNL